MAAVNPVASLLIVLGLFFTYERFATVAVSIAVVCGFAAVVLPLLLIRFLFAASWGKSLALYVAWGICGTLCGWAIALSVRAFVLETFYVPTSAMAPSIIGVHRLGACPHCGGKIIVSTPLEPDGRPVMQNTQGICSTCWRFDEAAQLGSELYFGDRVITSKLLRPKRWDIVTYYPPTAPGVLYTHRLVGLPGESVLIKEGQLWIDGVAQEPPLGLKKLVYVGSQEMQEQKGSSYGLEWGVDNKPCQLASDECFMLGDNTLRSLDSRFNGPVKMDQVTGVTTVLYWPPSRATIFP